jgi:DNA-binding SARP family transcriptional activator
MQYRILGRLEAERDGAPVALGGFQQRALLAMLLVAHGRTVTLDRLVDELWADEPPKSAVQTVRVYVSQLRRVIGEDPVETHESGYCLRIDPGELDADRFERLVADARACVAVEEIDVAQARFREALDLWQGPALAEFHGISKLAAEATRLEEARLGAEEDLIDLDLARGPSAALIPRLQELRSEHPRRERIAAQLMTALYRSGRQADALAAYEQTRQALDEIGLQPEEELRRLQRRILQQDSTLTAASSGPDDSRAEPAGRARQSRSAIRWFVAALGGAVVIGGALALLGLTSGDTSATTSATPALDLARNTASGPFSDAVGEVSVWRLDGARGVPIVRLSGCCPAWSSSRGAFALRVGSSRLGQLALVSDDGRHGVWLQPSAPSGLDLIPGAWSPNGRQLALTGTDRNHPSLDGVYTLTVPRVLSQFSGSHGLLNSQTVLTPPSRITRMRATRPELPLAYSPDGRSLLVFRQVQQGSGQLYVRTPTGKMVRVGSQMVWCCNFGSPASWQPNGRHIAYAGFIGGINTPPGLSAVFVADANGTHAHPITSPWYDTTSARWSPQGDWILFDRVNREPVGQHDEFLVRPDGSQTRVISTKGADHGGSCCAQWSPDGRYIAYQHTPPGSDLTVELSIVNVNGPPHPTLVRGLGHGYFTFAWTK